MTENRKTLLNSALTCKTFSETALDELWAAPRGGLYAVLRLLSTTVVKKEKHTGREYDPDSDSWEGVEYEADCYVRSPSCAERD